MQYIYARAGFQVLISHEPWDLTGLLVINAVGLQLVTFQRNLKTQITARLFKTGEGRLQMRRMQLQRKRAKRENISVMRTSNHKCVRRRK